MEQNITKNLNNLTRMLGADRLLTPEDVTAILTGIMQILAEYKKGTEGINEETKQVVNTLLEQVIKYNNETITDFKTEAEKAHGERIKELETLLKDIKTMVLDVEVLASNVRDGKDADEEKIVEDVISRIKIDPTVITVSAEEIRDKLASLKDEDRLDKSAIKGLEKILMQKDLDYAIATLQQQTSFLINKGGLKTVSHDASLSGDGTPENPLKVESTSGLTLETDGVANGDQTLLNLVAGTNMTLTDDGNGNITFDATGGAGSPGGSNTQLQYNNSGSFGGISGATTNGTVVTLTSPIIATSQTNSYATASTVPYFDASKNLVSSAVTPTELGYVSGVTSAIQTQLNAKQATITPAALTKTDDTNVTLTLGGTPATALLQATSLTLGWTGTLAVARGGTGQSSYTDGQLLIGNTSGNTLTKATLTGTSNQVVVTNGNGSITLSTPQDIGTSSNPQFATIELGNASDTTLSRSAAGQLAVEGVQVATISNAVALSNKTIAYSTEPSTDDTAYGETMAGILAGDTIAQWDLVYLDSSSGRWELADADAIGTAGNVLVGLAMTSGTDGNALTVLLKGIVRNDGWTWTGAGKVLYASTTAAAMSETAVSGEDDVVRVLGHTLSDDCIFFNPSVNWIIYKA